MPMTFDQMLMFSASSTPKKAKKLNFFSLFLFIRWTTQHYDA